MTSGSMATKMWCEDQQAIQRVTRHRARSHAQNHQVGIHDDYTRQLATLKRVQVRFRRPADMVAGRLT